jgi:hypothetical protein
VTTTTTLARCLIRGCPTRFRTGPDRLCHDHSQDGAATTLADRIAGLMGAPGDETAGQQA